MKREIQKPLSAGKVHVQWNCLLWQDYSEIGPTEELSLVFKTLHKGKVCQTQQIHYFILNPLE